MMNLHWIEMKVSLTARCFLYYLLFLVSIQEMMVNGQQCLPRFANLHPDHTACRSQNPRCKISKKGISQQERKLILDTHNQYRNLIASGNESGLGFPSASNMLTLEWDDDLAYVAQKHAELCRFEHDCYDCRQTGKYQVVGQNLYIYRTTRTSMEPQWRFIIKEWYDEIKIAPPKVAQHFELFRLNIGHFTQIAWAETSRIGCGMTTYSEDESENSIFKTVQLYTCNYAPGGNFIGEKMYENGNAASQCPKRTVQSKKFQSLCESPNFSDSSINVSTKPKNKPKKKGSGNKKNKNTVVLLSTTKPTTSITTNSITNSNNKRITTSTTTTFLTSSDFKWNEINKRNENNAVDSNENQPSPNLYTNDWQSRLNNWKDLGSTAIDYVSNTWTWKQNSLPQTDSSNGGNLKNTDFKRFFRNFTDWSGWAKPARESVNANSWSWSSNVLPPTFTETTRSTQTAPAAIIINTANNQNNNNNNNNNNGVSWRWSSFFNGNNGNNENTGNTGSTGWWNSVPSSRNLITTTNSNNYVTYNTNDYGSVQPGRNTGTIITTTRITQKPRKRRNSSDGNPSTSSSSSSNLAVVAEIENVFKNV